MQRIGANLYDDGDRTRELPEFRGALRGFGDDLDLQPQLGFSFKKLIKGVARYGNPIGLSVAVARGGVGLVRKTGVGRALFSAAEYLPGGHELNTLVGGRGHGGGSSAAAAAPARRKPKKKIRLRAAPRSAAAADEELGPPPPDDDAGGVPDEGGGDDDGGENEEQGDEGGDEEGGDIEGLFGNVFKKIGKAVATGAKAVGKVGAAVGKQALETYIGKPLSAAQQQQQIAKRPKAAPIWQNPVAIGAAGLAVVGGVVLATRKRK